MSKHAEETCGDIEPHGWQPCVKPKGHAGLHDLYRGTTVKEKSMSLYLRVPTEVHEELKRQAKERGWKIADAAREAIALGLGFTLERPFKPATKFVRAQAIPLTAMMTKRERNGGY